MRKSSLRKACEYCGKIYSYPPYRTKMTRFCSRRCLIYGHPEIAEAAHSACRGKSSHSFAKITIECLKCRKHFDVSPSRVGKKKFCSVGCYVAFRKVAINKYLFVRVNGKRIQMHRFVMQRKLGRKLSENEVVHHKNGDRSDNRLWNLQLLEFGEHSTLHLTAPRSKVIGKAKPKY